MIRAMLLAALAGAAAGALALWILVASPRIDAANARADAAGTQVETANSNLRACKLDVEGADAALDNLREQARLRETTASQAVQAAMTAASAAGDAVQQILAERTPEGEDACAAAKEAFDAELRRERAK